MRTEAPDTFELNANVSVESKRSALSPFVDLVAVVDWTQARIFGTEPFRIFDTLENELGREKSRTMRTERPSIDDGADPHEEAACQFARLLGHDLERRLKENAEIKILVVCEARMHGYLHRYLDDKRVLWQSADLGHRSEVQILNYLIERREELTAKNLVQ